MTPIPPKLRKEIEEDDFYQYCCHPKKNECRGRITWEHALIYAGRQIQEKWAIIPLCWYHHLGAGLDKAFNQKFAIERATHQELAKYPRLNIKALKYGSLINRTTV